jgi:hypothetical protein
MHMTPLFVESMSPNAQIFQHRTYLSKSSLVAAGYTENMSNPDLDNHDRVEFQSRLNVLRAGVLGANDGIVSIAALVVGVAAATSELAPVIIAGVAGIVAGSLSMALGEYVSVNWRYRWDLNPRWTFTHTTFRELHLRPLGHGTAH